MPNDKTSMGTLLGGVVDMAMILSFDYLSESCKSTVSGMLKGALKSCHKNLHAKKRHISKHYIL